MDPREEEFNPYAAPRVSDTQPESLEPELIVMYDNAGFWLRFAALLIDEIILVIVAQVLVQGARMVGVRQLEVDPNQPPNADQLLELMGAQVGLSLAVFAISLAYYVSMESSSWQGTLGKMAVGIKVTTLEGRRISVANALGRNLAKILSRLTCAIGYIMAGFTEKKQALHDILASTLVVKK
jgi:uncharacterized RDD family membrane protein YckC